MKIQKLITPFLHNKFFNHTSLAFLHYPFSTDNYKYPPVKLVKPSDRGTPLIKLAKGINNLPTGSIK